MVVTAGGAVVVLMGTVVAGWVVGGTVVTAGGRVVALYGVGGAVVGAAVVTGAGAVALGPVALGAVVVGLVVVGLVVVALVVVGVVVIEVVVGGVGRGLMDVVDGTVDGAWRRGERLVLRRPWSVPWSGGMGSVVVEETIDGTIGLVEEVGVVVDDGTDVEEVAGDVATALPATPRYSHETVMVGTRARGWPRDDDGKVPPRPPSGPVALQPAVLAAVPPASPCPPVGPSPGKRRRCPACVQLRAAPLVGDGVETVSARE